jgi:hypothetical protein
MLDGVMLLWFLLTAAALLFVAVDIRNTPESPVLKWGFTPKSSRLRTAARFPTLENSASSVPPCSITSDFSWGSAAVSERIVSLWSRAQAAISRSTPVRLIVVPRRSRPATKRENT